MSQIKKALIVARIKDTEKAKRGSLDTHKRGPWDRGKVKKAEGGDVDKPAFDPSKPFEASDQKPAFDPSKPFETPKAQESSWTDYIPAAIKDVPKEVYNAGAEQVRGVGDAWNSIRDRHAAQAERDKSGAGFFDPQGILGVGQDIADTGKAVVHGASALPAAVFQGPFRSLVGHPMADLTHGIGTIINPEAAAKDNPDKMYDNAKHDVDLALSAARPRGFSPSGPLPVATSPLVAPEAQSARALADEFQIKLSRGQATGDLDRIRYEDMAARGAYGPEAQERAAAFFQKQFDDMQRGARGVGEQLGQGEQPLASPADAGSSLNTNIADRALAARQARDAAVAQSEQEATAQRAMVDDSGRSITESIEGGRTPIESPRDAGEIVANQLRERAAAEREGFRNSYREAYSLPGEFDRSHFEGLGNRIRNDLTLRDEPVVVDQLTPAASSALDHLNNIENLRLVNRAQPQGTGLVGPAGDDAQIVAVNMRGLDRARRILQSSYRRAATPEDRRATSAIIGAFDEQVEQSIAGGLFSGDPRALEMLQQARGQFRVYQQRYNPQRQGDDVGTAMRRIVDRGATPEETTNLIIGSGKIGNAGLPVRIADRLEQTLGADSEAWNAIRQAMWRRASQVRKTSGEIDPDRSATNILDFAGSTLGRRMFSPEELTAMRGHAQSVRNLDRTIESLPETAAAQRVQSNYEQVFGGDGLSGAQKAVFRRMVEGTATPEETSQAMFSVIAGGNPGNASRALAAIEGIVGKDSPIMGTMRQGVWQKLTQNPFGKDQLGQQKMVQSINEFLNGKGREIARQLYTPEQRDLMNRYAEAVRKTIIPKYARTNSDTAPAMLAAVRKYAGAIGTALGFGVHGGITGGLEGYAVGKMLDKIGEKASHAYTTKKLNDTLEDIIPAGPKPIPPPNSRNAARVLPLSVHGGSSVNIGNTIRRLQGPSSAGAQDEKPKP